jgi:transketolase|tara:strand:- start:380 stop:1345 length:966 start_codon:yes stop_codon:yes gene_type:complete
MIDQKKIKTYSLIGARATFGMYALDLIKENPNLLILSGDVSTSAGLDRFRKQYPNNYYEIGIAEQNLIGVAAGLASENFDVITTTFAPFQTLRCCEQIKVNLSYMKQKVVMIGLASGLVQGPLGYTHCSIEDLSIIRSLPNLNIISPADSLETTKAIDAALKSNQSTYIRITGSTNNPIVYDNDYEFNLGESVTLKKGKDVALIATGPMVSESLKAYNELKEKNIDASVINIHTIKPIDKKKIIEIAKTHQLILTIEEHSVIGGLSSAVSEIISSDNYNCKQLSIGVNDTYDKGGSYEFLKNKHGLNSQNIISKVIKNLKN